MASMGIDTVPAHKAVSPGIQSVQSRMKLAGDGLPRIFMLRDSLVERDLLLIEDTGKPLCTEQEVDGYLWEKNRSGKPIKEIPLKLNDHGMDAMRYGVAYADNLSQQVVWEIL